ncbi:MAG: hypothetical protein JNK82_35255 [Myxococcaceae bacterium]|nr:hypothetical protein [Myxococcaceae bacterium]
MRWVTVQGDLLSTIAQGTAGGGPSVDYISVGTGNVWVGGVLTPRAHIIGIPLDTNTEGLFDLNIDAGTVDTPSFTVPPQRFVGGVLGPDDFVYGLPHSGGTQLLRMSTVGSLAPEVVGDALDAGTNTTPWGAGVVAPNGDIYVLPFHGNHVLRFDPDAGTSRLVAGPFALASEKWFGAVLGPNGKIYGVPYAASAGVLVLDPSDDSTTILTVTAAPGGGWQGGTLAADGHIYCTPNRGGFVLEIDPVTNSTSAFDAGTSGTNQFVSGALGADGKIYALPSNHQPIEILVINPVTKTTTFLAASSVMNDPWDGLVSAPDGKLYGIPKNDDRVLVIDPKANRRFPMRTLLSPFLNKY